MISSAPDGGSALTFLASSLIPPVSVAEEVVEEPVDDLIVTITRLSPCHIPLLDCGRSKVCDLGDCAMDRIGSHVCIRKPIWNMCIFCSQVASI